MRTTTVTKLLLLGMASSVLVSCGKKNGFENLSVDIASTDKETASKYNVNLYKMNETVCDPWGGEEPPQPEKGIKASLHYKGAGGERYYTAREYIDKATKSSQTLFFTDLNVPTRMFHQGFATQTSDVVKDDAGEKLIEFFGMKFETVIKLRPDQAEGNYEIALLADDGVVLKGLVNGQIRTIVNSDGDHPTRMGCSVATINMTYDTALPVELVYYQGPRYHIANVMMWRKSEDAGKDPLCGATGNHLFFNPDQDSKPLQAYKDLEARGWEPISADNFHVPSDASYNPCTEGTAPVITGFRTLEIGSEDIQFSWNTDIPATTQVMLTDVATGEKIITDSDNILRQNHSVRARGLKPGTVYKAQAVAISADLGKGMSAEIEVSTLD